MISIKILSGERKSEVFELFDISSTQSIPVTIREDEIVSFKVILDVCHDSLILAIHEIEIESSKPYRHDNSWVYEWQPKDGKECFFLNFYGFAELNLISKEAVGSFDEYKIEILMEFHPIEVLAKKINAERFEKMLNFLARQDGKDLASAFRVTRIKAGLKDGGRTDSFLLDKIENNVEFIKRVLPSILTTPLSKLHQNRNIVIPDNSTLIDEVSLCWLTENPDVLFQVFSLDEAVISHDGSYFSTNKIMESKAEASVDIYENRVIHGFVLSLIKDLKSIRKRLIAGRRPEEISRKKFDGYVSLFTQIDKFSSAINKNKIDKCSYLLMELSSIYGRICNKIPVSRPWLDSPRFTQKSKYNILYRQIFERYIAWRRFGAPDWSFQDELCSIQNIPKLFEYYLLCVVKYHIESNFYGESVFINDMNDRGDIFEYNLSEGKIRLMYEPDIWAYGHKSAYNHDLVNIEGWTIDERKKNDGITRRGTKGGRSKRCPDIIIQLISKNGISKYIIIDAKYTDSTTAFSKYLPELTMKYIHGIHRQNSEINPTFALMIINPNENSSTRHFHHHDYSIYGKYCATPALLVTSIDVSKSHEEGSNLRKDIARIIKIIQESNKTDDK